MEEVRVSLASMLNTKNSLFTFGYMISFLYKTYKHSLTYYISGGSRPLLGDFLVIVGTMFYAVTNVGEVRN